MTDHHSPQEPLIMDIFVQEQSKISYVDMPHKLVIMYQEDLAGIAMVFQSNIKSINN